MPPSVGPRIPMFPPGGPGLGQQIFYGQGPPALIPQVSGLCYNLIAEISFEGNENTNL